MHSSSCFYYSCDVHKFQHRFPNFTQPENYISILLQSQMNKRENQNLKQDGEYEMRVRNAFI